MKIYSIMQKRNSRWKKGKGFSADELKDASMGFKQALQLGVPIDLRRKTKYKKMSPPLKNI